MVEALNHRCRPTTVPKQIEVIQRRLDGRQSRPASIQTSSAVTIRSAIPELRMRFTPLPFDWQASSEPKSTTSRTGDTPVNSETDGELVLRSALGEDILQELSRISANGTLVREEFGIGVESADALEVIELPRDWSKNWPQKINTHSLLIRWMERFFT